ncbi:MAG: hypothetical protein QOD99_38 [Chthoniobacter sp.]|nr:hypothetical protein [Chthoniobacter sp.]
MKVQRIILATIFAISAYLSLGQLGEPALWDDEAHVALYARSFLQIGHWSAWDGRNLAGGDRNGAYLNNELRHVMPQLDYVIAAGAFRVFGVSTWTARIAFALAGMAALGAFYLWLKMEMPREFTLHSYALASLAFSVTWLLNIRTCRYYSLAALLLLAGLIAYKKFFQTKNWLCLGLLALCAALLFYTSALVCGAFLLALAARHFIFYGRDCARREWLLLGGCGTLFLALILPYALTCVRAYTAAARAEQAASGAHPEPWLASRFILLWWNVRELNTVNALPWLIIAGLAAWYFFSAKEDAQTQREKRAVAEWSCIAAVYVTGIALLSPQPVQLTRIADVRYLSPALPLFAALCAVVFTALHRRTTIHAGVSALVIFVMTNLGGVWPTDWNFRWLLPEFVNEINTPYPTSCSEAAKYLRQHASKDDHVFALPDFIQKPLVFYVGDHVRVCGLLDHRTHLPAAAVERCDPALLIEDAYPEWIVSCGAQPNLGQIAGFFSRPHTPAGTDKTVTFQYQLAQLLPVYWDQTQRPELPWHSFGPKQRFNPASEAVYIFKRRNTVP